MSKWLQKLLHDEKAGDKSDKLYGEIHLSLLSPEDRGLSDQNPRNKPRVVSDKHDKPHDENHLSLLSLHDGALSDQNLRNKPGVVIDKRDKPHDENHMSLLSPAGGVLSDQNLRNRPGVVSDKHDTEIQSIIDNYEERAAIVEYYGGSTATEAERIAYLEAFTQTLAKFSHDDSYEPPDDWLEQRIKAIQSWLSSIGLQQPD